MGFLDPIEITGRRVKLDFTLADIYPDNKPKPVLCYYKREAAHVDITDQNGGDSFIFTPHFGRFKGIGDLEKYLIKYVKDNKLDDCDVNIEWCRHCIFEVNPETYELGKYLESSGIEGEYLEWNEEEQEFQDREDEEEEYDEDEE